MEGKVRKVGQEVGEIRSSLPLDRLEPYLRSSVRGYEGPLTVKQFKVCTRAKSISLS